MNDYQIRRMTREEVDHVVDWAAREGWNPGLNDAPCFWSIDPEGFFAGVLDGKIVACGSALRYDDRFAFCGFYIVAPEHRGRGLGLELTRARLAHVGGRNVGLDGVVTMVDRYARLGYSRAHTTTRYSFTPRQHCPMPAWIVSASEVPVAELAEYDARCFFARRDRFLSMWLTQPDTRAVVARDGRSVRGYGVLRPCRMGFKVGPLFADDADLAQGLLGALCNEALQHPVTIDIPEPNAAGREIAARLEMIPVFACIRMYLRGDPGLPLERIYGITSFEAG